MVKRRAGIKGAFGNREADVGLGAPSASAIFICDTDPSAECGRRSPAVTRASATTNRIVGLKALDTTQRLGEFDATLINSNVPGAVDGAPATAVVELPGGKRVGLLGLLTSEPGVFRKDVFRGLEIADVLSTAKTLAAELRADERPRSSP